MHNVKLLLIVCLTGSSYAGAQTVAQQLMELDSIVVTGTKLPSESIIKLSGLKVHDKINDLTVNTACHKITATGLIKNISYAYDAYPDKPGVVLNLAVTDETPVVPAVIKPAKDETLWACLQAADPIYKREFPPTEKALAFYTKAFASCLHGQARDNEYAGSDLSVDKAGSPTGVTFEIRAYKNAAPRK